MYIKIYDTISHITQRYLRTAEIHTHTHTNAPQKSQRPFAQVKPISVFAYIAQSFVVYMREDWKVSVVCLQNGGRPYDFKCLIFRFSFLLLLFGIHKNNNLLHQIKDGKGPCSCIKDDS